MSEMYERCIASDQYVGQKTGHVYFLTWVCTLRP